MKPLHAVLACALGAMAVASPAAATERLFTYTYQTGVLAPGQVEVEPWTTFRYGRDKYYLRLDNRIELETGVVPGLQTAWYLNVSSQTQEVLGKNVSQSTLQGVSWEWKWKLLDPVADALGLALYGEVGAGPAVMELEWKALLDKKLGPVTLAANLVGEIEWLRLDEGSEQEIEIETDWGVAWSPAQSWSLGLEARTHTEIVEGEVEHTALFAGPAISYAQQRWWIAATFMPQIPTQAHEHGVLDEHEKTETRLLVGVHF